MPVKWSTLKASEAIDSVEEHINNATTPLQLAREEAKKALEIPNLPGYMESRFAGLATECEWIIGKLQTKIRAARDDIPKDQLAREQKRQEEGVPGSLM